MPGSTLRSCYAWDTTRCWNLGKGGPLPAEGLISCIHTSGSPLLCKAALAGTVCRATCWQELLQGKVRNGLLDRQAQVGVRLCGGLEILRIQPSQCIMYAGSLKMTPTSCPSWSPGQVPPPPPPPITHSLASRCSAVPGADLWCLPQRFQPLCPLHFHFVSPEP